MFSLSSWCLLCTFVYCGHCESFLLPHRSATAIPRAHCPCPTRQQGSLGMPIPTWGARRTYQSSRFRAGFHQAPDTAGTHVRTSSGRIFRRSMKGGAWAPGCWLPHHGWITTLGTIQPYCPLRTLGRRAHKRLRTPPLVGFLLFLTNINTLLQSLKQLSTSFIGVAEMAIASSGYTYWKLNRWPPSPFLIFENVKKTVARKSRARVSTTRPRPSTRDQPSLASFIIFF